MDEEELINMKAPKPQRVEVTRHPVKEENLEDNQPHFSSYSDLRSLARKQHSEESEEIEFSVEKIPVNNSELKQEEIDINSTSSSENSHPTESDCRIH